MSSHRGALPLSYRRIARSDLTIIGSLELDLDQVKRFLGPLPDIIGAVRRGLAYSMIGVELSDRLIGFYVVHPDTRDRSCWWLGWFAIDRRCQGCGYGHAVMVAIMDRLRRIEGCCRVRLLVAPENAYARRLYGKAGFSDVDVLQATGELIMECPLEGHAPPGVIMAPDLRTMPMCAVRSALRAMRLPSATRAHGVTHGPPNAVLASA